MKSIVDIKIWGDPYLSRVTDLIASKIKDVIKSLPPPEPNKALMSSTIELDGIGQKDMESNKSTIVISAHPQQISIVTQIKSILSEEYNIWCSTDLPEGGLIEEDLTNNITPPFTPEPITNNSRGLGEHHI